MRVILPASRCSRDTGSGAAALSARGGPARAAAEEGAVAEGGAADVAPGVQARSGATGREQTRNRCAVEVEDVSVDAGAQAADGEDLGAAARRPAVAVL